MKNRSVEILLALFFPIYGVISYFKKQRTDYFSFPLFIFFIFFGLLFVVPEQGDASRHLSAFQSSSDMSWEQVVSEVQAIGSFKSSSHSDIYVLLSGFLVSRVSTSPSFYFGFHAFVYGILFLFLFKLLSHKLPPRVNIIHQIIFITLFLVMSIAKIQYVRFFLAALLYLYGSYSFIVRSNKKFWIYFILGCLVHISMAIPSLLFIVFTFFKSNINLWFIVSLFSFFSSNFLSQYTGDILSFSNEYAADSRVEEMAIGYVGNEDYIVERAARFDERRWFTSYHIYLTNALAVLSFVFYFVIKFKKCSISSHSKILFSFSLFFFSLSRFGSAFASVGERFNNLFLFSSLYFYLLIYPNLILSYRRLLFIPILPFLLLFIAMSLREIIGVVSVFSVIGSTFVIPMALDDPISIYDFFFN